MTEFYGTDKKEIENKFHEIMEDEFTNALVAAQDHAYQLGFEAGRANPSEETLAAVRSYNAAAKAHESILQEYAEARLALDAANAEIEKLEREITHLRSTDRTAAPAATLTPTIAAVVKAAIEYVDLDDETNSYRFSVLRKSVWDYKNHAAPKMQEYETETPLGQQLDGDGDEVGE